MAMPENDKILEFRAEALRVAAQLPQIRAAFAPVNFVAPETQAEIDRGIAEAPGRAARVQENEILLSHGSIDGVQERGQEAAKGIQQRAALARQASEQTSSTAWFLEMLTTGEGMGEFVGGAVFGDMDDEQIMACVAEIELETGKPFEVYAAEILGDEMPEREPGQSDADYAREVLIALADEMIERDPTTGEPRIKEQYKDDPTAQVILRDEKFEEIRGSIKRANEMLDAGAPPEEVVKAVKPVVEESYAGSKAVGQDVESEKIAEFAVDAGDEHSDDDSKLVQNEDRSSSYITDIFAVAASDEQPTTTEVSSSFDRSSGPSAAGNDPSPT